MAVADKIEVQIDTAAVDEWLAENECARIVRCKDCKHRDPEDGKCDSGGLERAGCSFPVDDNYFCADGERR